jgi:hypothetical protein
MGAKKLLTSRLAREPDFQRPLQQQEPRPRKNMSQEVITGDNICSFAAPMPPPLTFSPLLQSTPTVLPFPRTSTKFLEDFNFERATRPQKTKKQKTRFLGFRNSSPRFIDS